jgi:hypothetical protein
MKLAVAHMAPAKIVVFTDVANYVYAAIRDLGYDVVLCPPNTFAHDRLNIILGNNILDHPDLADLVVPAGSIFYNFEQATPRWLESVHAAVLRYRPIVVWDWSPESTKAFVARGVPAVHVPLGYVPEMIRIPRVRPQSIDVLFLGSVSERRRKVLRECVFRGLRLHRGDQAWAGWRDVVIGASKVVLNMHFYEPDVPPAFEVVRVLPLLANGIAVVSERGAGHERFASGVHFVDDASQIADACEALVKNDTLRFDLEERAVRVVRQPENHGREFVRAPLARIGQLLEPRSRRAWAV